VAGNYRRHSRHIVFTTKKLEDPDQMKITKCDNFMKEHQFNLRFSVVTLVILLAAASRLLPHPPTFSPLGGMALFGAAYYGRRAMAYLIPSVSMWISDLAVNNILYSQYFDRSSGFTAGQSSLRGLPCHCCFTVDLFWIKIS
jgi:hypothetical protein